MTATAQHISRTPRQAAEDKYREALIRVPSEGTGLHAWHLKAANLARLAGVERYQAEADMAAAVPPGRRKKKPREINEALDLAWGELSPADGDRTASSGHHAPIPWRHTAAAPLPAKIDGAAARDGLVAAGGGEIDPDCAELWESSPVRIDWPIEEDGWRMMEALYRPDEFLFLGGEFSTGRDTVRTVADWAALLRREIELVREFPAAAHPAGFCRLAARYPHIAPNPLCGDERMTKQGKPSFRCDAAVCAWRYVTAEFDGIPIKQQLAFWRGIGLKVAALIHTGGKSVHAWLVVNARTAGEWEAVVEGELFRRLEPLGLDRACKNECRLSRLPGVPRLKRRDDGRLHEVVDASGRLVWQRLLWLAPGGAALT